MQNNLKVTAGDYVSATRKYSNREDDSRKFDINANVNIAYGKVTNFTNGSLVKREDPTNGSATFSKGESWISFNVNNMTEEEAREAFNAVADFFEAVNSSVELLNEGGNED